MAGVRFTAAARLFAVAVALAALAGCATTSAAPLGGPPSAAITAPVAPGPTATVTPARSAALRTSTGKPPKLPVGARVRVLRTELTAPSTGVELFPVARREPHVVAAATVYSTRLFGDEPELRSHPSTIELATYRSSLNGGRIEFGDASSLKSVRSLLAWVVIYSGIGPVWPNTGPYIPPGSPSPSSRPIPTDCQWVYLADAVTGRYVSAFGDCPGELKPVRTG